MEVERDVKVKYVDSDSELRNSESGFTAGLRAASSLPKFTRHELEAEQGEVALRIAKLFSTLYESEAEPPDTP
jgi:hypothetical protein